MEFQLTPGKIKIFAGKSEFEMSTLDANDFPDNQVNQATLTFELAGKEMTTLFDTAYAAADTELRPILMGVYLGSNDQGILGAATDSQQVCSGVVQKADLLVFEVVIPSSSAAQAIKLLGAEEAITVKVGDNLVIFQTEAMMFTTALLEGTYPCGLAGIHRFVPQSYEGEIEVNRQQFMNGLERATILAKEIKNNVPHLSRGCSLHDSAAKWTNCMRHLKIKIHPKI